MKTKLMLCAILMCVTSEIAVGQQVSVNYNHSQSFAGYHTYAWASNNANQIQNSILAQVPQQDIDTALDQVANKVIQKYQTASCQQLWAERSQHAPPTPAEAKAIQFLHSDPQMRTLFINKVAAPVANKMFECGMIP